MIRWLLDTNAVSSLLAGRMPLARRVRLHAPSQIAISAIVAHELYYGAFRSRRRDSNLDLVDTLHFEVVPFDQDDARHAGAIRAALAASGTPIGPYDVLIAGQARSRGLVLVTANTGEFARVEGLAIEDWSR